MVRTRRNKYSSPNTKTALKGRPSNTSYPGGRDPFAADFLDWRRVLLDVERLEDRISPTAQPLSYAVSPDGAPDDLLLRLDTSSSDLQILEDGAVMASQALAKTSSVEIVGADNEV